LLSSDLLLFLISLVGLFVVSFEIVKPRVGLRARHDSGDVRIHAVFAWSRLVSPQLGFAAASSLLFPPFVARPLPLAFPFS
jgi:hypothetical protein